MKHRKGLLSVILAIALACALLGTAGANTGKVMQELEYRDISVTLDGETLDLRNTIGEKVEPFMFGGTNYLPVRALAENLGLKVAWNGQTATVVLTTPSPIPEAESKIPAVLQSVDAMERLDFEYWTAALLRRVGFSDVTVTQASGDQGVDVTAEKDGIRYAIQCKRYSSNLGNDQVQEVFTGKSVYYAHVGAVITNQHFTAGAQELAETNCVLLWDRGWIESQLKKLEAAGVDVAFSPDKPVSVSPETPPPVEAPAPVETVPAVQEEPAPVVQAENPSPVEEPAPVAPAPAEPAAPSVPSKSIPSTSGGTGGNGGGNGDGNNFDYWDIPENQQTEARYVLNNSTMKIHSPTCSQVKKIAPQNYGTSNKSIAELLAEGYTRCGVCGAG